jgi:hypothetical protein
MTVTCENQECSEFEILKSGDSFPIEQIICGKCHGPVTEVPEADDNG